MYFPVVWWPRQQRQYLLLFAFVYTYKYIGMRLVPFRVALCSDSSIKQNPYRPLSATHNGAMKDCFSFVQCDKGYYQDIYIIYYTESKVYV